MLHLQGPQMLQMLEKSLRKSLPESLKVYGTVFHMNQGNPFKLKALVDDWPDFNTVVVCPQEQDSKQHLDDAKTKHYYFLHPIFGKSVNQWKEMTDDLDHYSNTYVIYSKDPKNCKEFLGSPKVINWKQHLQIQSSQSNLDEVIGSLAAVQSCMVKKTQCFLYVIYETAKKLFPSVLDAKKLSPSGGKHKFINQELFKLSSLDVTHAALVNKFWHFGGNEKSQRFIERCIRTFPSFCLLGPEGTLVSWSLMDQTGELRMAGTMPEYRAQGLIYHVISAQIQALDKLGFPMYSHVDKSNHSMQRLSFNLQSVCMPCDWNQWKCVPR